MIMLRLNTNTPLCFFFSVRWGYEDNGSYLSGWAEEYEYYDHHSYLTDYCATTARLNACGLWIMKMNDVWVILNIKCAGDDEDDEDDTRYEL